MMLKRFVALAASLAVITALPWVLTSGVEAGASEPDRIGVSLSNPVEVDEVSVSPVAFEEVYRPELPGLKPRREKPKPADHRLQIGADESGRLIVKFRDTVQARAVPEARGQVASRAGMNLASFADIVDRFGLTVEPAIKMSEQRLANIETRAALLSNEAQPDLAGMLHVTGPRHIMERVARMINALDTVEYVEVEPNYTLGRMGGGDPVGACCPPEGTCLGYRTAAECAVEGGVYLGDGSVCTGLSCVRGACCSLGACTEVTLFECDQALGTFGGYGTECGDDACDPGTCCVDEECFQALDQFDCMIQGGSFLGTADCADDPCEGQVDCGEPGAGPCFMVHGSPYCDNSNCCETVCDILPTCCAEFGQWDSMCVQIAHLVCTINDGADRCLALLGGPCFESHPRAGCNLSDCCYTVCEADPSCCELGWNNQCVNLALSLCGSCDPSFPGTPDFTATQGYRFGEAYANMPTPVPAHLAPYGPFPFSGWGGEGFDLRSPYPDDDPAFDAYAGMWGLARELLEVYGAGSDLVDQGILHPVWGGGRGAGIKVGVVEWAYYENHEDLDVTTVLPEGDQMIVIQDITSPDHGTASLGIICALENDFGMTGIAPDAEAYFFPMTSVNHGPRTLTAMAEAIELFGPGDILSFSWGPRSVLEGGTINSRESTHDLLSIAGASGIVCTIAAGNDCYNLDGAEDLGDSRAIVVGAVTPGWPYNRLTFSNYFRDQEYFAGEDGVAENTSTYVHISAWGELVASLGYGESFTPDCAPARSYTFYYNGTSAATPQIAGLAACLQGFALQFYGIPLSPVQIRDALRFERWPQQGIVDPADRSGAEEVNGFSCLPDVNPDEDVNNVEGYPNARQAAGGILTQGFLGFDQFNTELKQVYVIRGSHVHGNIFSVRAFDSVFYIGRSMQTQSSSKPTFTPPAFRRELSNITYLASGEIVDILAVAQAEQDTVTTLNVLVAGPAVSVPSMIFLELYDWNERQWVVNGAQFIAAGDPYVVGNFPQFGTQRFVRGSDRTILIRCWAYGFPVASPFNPGSSPQPFDFRIDQIDIDLGGFVEPKD